VQTQQLIAFVVDKIDDMKAKDIVQLNVSGKSTETECLVVCTGTSNRHTRSVAAHLVVEAKKAGLHILGVEGEKTGEWVLVDLGEVVVHVMLDESRSFYQLEKLWAA